ncbi:hypothetical protein Leryth_024716 [Lithospermum erythrorhizon]|nr:hypothetical protein Leryth_024716 [Lithospermum erythrorhizon]
MTESENLEAYSVPRKLPEDVKLKKHKIFEEKVERAELFDGHERPDRNFNLAEHEAISSFNSCDGSGEEEIDVGFLAIDNHMEEPDELSEKHKCTLNELSNGKYQKHASGNRQDAERFAIQLLSTRAFTASELRKKLQGRNFPLETVDMVVADFQNRGYINDCLYAEAFSRSDGLPHAGVQENQQAPSEKE